VAIRTPEEEEKKRKQRLRREGYAEKEGFKRGTHTGDVVVTPTRRRIDHRTFSVAAPRAWNTLPTQLKLPRPTTTFRRQLKTFLFKSSRLMILF